MNKDNLKGKAKDIAGRVERQAGEWTGDEKSQARGLARQAEGKVQKAWGDLKDAGQRAKKDIRGPRAEGEGSDTRREGDLERDVQRDEEAA